MRLPLIILVASFAAFGANRPTVVVVPFSVGEGASESSANKFTRLLNEELKTRDDVMDVVAAPATKSAAPVEKPAAAGSPSSGPKKNAPSPEA